MCGRYRLTPSVTTIIETFGVDIPPQVEPRFNISPTEPVLVIRVAPGTGQVEATHMRWGLIPSWAKDPSIGSKLINARAETAAEKPSFRNALRYRRCLLPASGFYEWQRLPGRGANRPHHIALTGGRVFGMAGLWEQWTGPNGEQVETCAILTTEANECIQPFHDRMPVIIRPGDIARWLDPTIQRAAEIVDLLAPFPPDEMTVTLEGPTPDTGQRGARRDA